MTLATCTDLITAKGTKISIGSANLGGSPTYTEIGMVESFGEFGPDANVGTFVPVGTGIAGKYMGATDNGELSLTIAKTTTDTGLTELIAAQNSDDALAYKIELSDGTEYTFNGLCRSCRVNVGSGDEVVKINAAIALTGALNEA
jgi:hypothetical protein